MNTYLYFSGTGNSKFVAETFHNLEKEAKIYSIEDPLDFDTIIKESSEIILLYPIYTSMMPIPMTEFIIKHSDSFKNKTVNTIATQMMFSGDGGMLPLRLLRSQNVKTKYTLHVFMPNNISDVSFLPIKKSDKLPLYLEKKQHSLQKKYNKIIKGKHYKHGRRWYSRSIAFLLQRCFAEKVHHKLSSSLSVSNDCIHCNKCVNICPVDNLFSKNSIIHSKNQCVVCYRCVNICPTQSITIVGSTKPKKQHFIK